MDESAKTPVAIFAYNRPRHLRQLLESLLQCARLDECQVHIFCDGLKKPEHAAAVHAARQVVDEFAPKLNAIVIKRDENIGLARSIVSGVSELCEQYGRAIVLEDDFILHPFFVNFMLQSLDRYADDDRIAQVSGFTFPIQTSSNSDAFFLPLTTSWGWATWAAAWKLFSWDTHSALSQLGANPRLRSRFDLDDTYPYFDMLRNASAGTVDSWAIRWYWSVFSAGKLTLYPHKSLVWQNGFDESATHTRSARDNLQASRRWFYRERWEKLVMFPITVNSDDVAFESLKRFLQRSTPRISVQRVYKALKRKIIGLIK